MTEKAFMSDETHATLDQAIAAARAGHRDDAIRMLRQIVADDPFNADAWVWLGGLATDPREQRSALEQALVITPHNQRAQQGLGWLRQTHPDVFAPLEQRPRTPETTPSYQQQAAYPAASDTAPQTRAAIYEAPAQSAAMPYDAPTEAMPVTYRAQAEPRIAERGQQTDRMAAFTPVSAPVVDTTRTDRMATMPPPTAPAADVVYRRSPGAEVARWLVLLTWIFSFGAVATFAALIWAFPNNFEASIQPLLAIFQLRLVPQDVAATRSGTAIGLSVMAVVDLMIILGLLFRGRWAWAINMLIATAIMLGAAALVGLTAAGLTPFSPGGFVLNTLPELILAGLLAFTVGFFLLSLGSRRAFFRRRVEQRA